MVALKFSVCCSKCSVSICVLSVCIRSVVMCVCGVGVSRRLFRSLMSLYIVVCIYNDP